MRKTLLISILAALVLGSASALVAVGPTPADRPLALSLSQESAESSFLSRHSPAQPKWGDTLEVVYNPAIPKAAFAIGDEVYAFYSVSPGDKQGWIRLEPRDGSLTGSLPVEEGAGYFTIYFMTQEKLDRKAALGIKVYRADGKPARGAWHHEMLESFSPDSYLSLFEKERTLYPDNYAVYRDKWFIESAVKKGELEAIVGKELPILEKAAARKETPELLYSLSYGNLLLGREEAGRKFLERLAETSPLGPYTASAFTSYEYQAFSNQWKGEGPERVRQLAVGLIAKFPESASVRSLFERHVGDEDLSSGTAGAVCRAWIRDEPENPHPYYYFALAAKSKNGDMEEAEKMISRAIELLLRGNLRFFGDIGGAMTDLRMPGFYSLRAELRREQGDLSNALADIKAAEGVSKETRPDYLVIEGSIWSKLGFLNRAVNCFVGAFDMGSKEAEDSLREIYVRRSGGEAGFAEYLAGVRAGLAAAQKESGGTGKAVPSKAPPAAAKAPAPDFAVTTLDGAEIKLSDLKGKVVILNFWFIGCAPCRVEMPGLNTLVEEFSGNDVVFLGFATDRVEPLREFLAKNEFKYRIVPEASKIASQYDVSLYPTHILIGKDGRIAYFLTGGSPDRHEQLRPLIRNLLR